LAATEPRQSNLTISISAQASANKPVSRLCPSARGVSDYGRKRAVTVRNKQITGHSLIIRCNFNRYAMLILIVVLSNVIFVL